MFFLNHPLNNRNSIANLWSLFKKPFRRLGGLLDLSLDRPSAESTSSLNMSIFDKLSSSPGHNRKQNRRTKVFKSRNLRSINGLYYVQVINSESVYRCIGYLDCPNPDLNRTHFGLSRPVFLYHLRAENESVFIRWSFNFPANLLKIIRF